MSLPVADRLAVRAAALLHDLGFVAIPARLRLVDSGGAGEHTRLHPYYGQRLLGRSNGLARLGAIVGEHHERLDGSGFHRGSRARDLSLAGRLLAVAEAYRGMVENRPPRPARSVQQAASAIREEVRLGRLDASAAEAVLEAAGHRSRNKKPVLPAGLTAREVEVLRLVAVGRPVKEIATRLGVAPKTVGNHVQNLYAKIGVGTRAGATLFALETGLLDPAADS
jgi:HD-GYP domain-containing protein (c-di-GMP phosphodiesterase class II)